MTPEQKKSLQDIKDAAYIRGYMTAMEEVNAYINTLDETDIKTLRSRIYQFCIGARPYVIPYK